MLSKDKAKDLLYLALGCATIAFSVIIGISLGFTVVVYLTRLVGFIKPFVPYFH